MNEMIDGTLNFDEGDLVDGVVVKIEHDEVLVDIGFKSERRHPVARAVHPQDADLADIVELGEKIEASVLQKGGQGRASDPFEEACRNTERAWIRASKRSSRPAKWSPAKSSKSLGGGLILNIGLRGFLPASLVDRCVSRISTCTWAPRSRPASSKWDRNRNNVCWSRRVLLEEGRKERARGNPRPSFRRACASRARFPPSWTSARSSTWAALMAWCTSPELSWNHVNHPSEVVKGDEVEVEVLDVDLQRERISLASSRRRKTRGSAGGKLPGGHHRGRQG